MAKSVADWVVLSPSDPTTHLTTCVMDQNLRFKEFVPWQKALTMYSRGAVTIIQPYLRDLGEGLTETVNVRTPSHIIPLPFVVTINSYVYDPYAGYLMSRSEIATKRAILTRDRGECAYQFRRGQVDAWGEPDGCTGRGNTIDHILPQSRGGENTWENLIASCMWCNNYKADRTPEEAGMTLMFEPQTYDGYVVGGRMSVEAEIHAFLMKEAGVITQ